MVHIMSMVQKPGGFLRIWIRNIHMDVQCIRERRECCLTLYSRITWTYISALFIWLDVAG